MSHVKSVIALAAALVGLFSTPPAEAVTASGDVPVECAMCWPWELEGDPVVD